MNILILPHQLFDIKYFPKDIDIKKVFIHEHPQYFTKYNFNKKKLILHRASMKKYEQYLLNEGYEVKYYEYKKKPIFKKNTFIMFDPIDKLGITSKVETVLETPNFLLKKEDYQKYRQKSDKFVFQSFYMFGKKITDIIPSIKSQDAQNRKKLGKGIKIPDLPINLIKEDKEFINEAIDYVEKHFKNNYGNVDDFQLPISHKCATKWLDDFIKNKFEDFGPYEDAIKKEEAYLFHSVLSSSINIGLINPLEIIDRIRPIKNKISLNSYEGYVRQLYWREYQRYCYIYCDFSDKTFFGGKKKLDSKWYTGDLGIDPVDDAIKMAFDKGYLHHIYRLMVVGNWMNLNEIDPWEGFKWFMEFSCDSYEWVMHQNVLDMVFFVSGATMRKPYCSKSNYIIKMSDYKKGKWSEIWDETYDKFVLKHKEKLWKYRYHFPILTKKK